MSGKAVQLLGVRMTILAFVTLGFLIVTPYAGATEGPTTPADAMDWCCAELFGKWRGKAWMTAPDGRRVDMDAEIEVIRSADGGVATFIEDYTPLVAGDGERLRRVSLLTSTIGLSNGNADFAYTLRYLRGGPYWGVRDFFPEVFVPTTWTVPAPGGGFIRYVSSSTGSEWSLAGFCCSGQNSDRLSSYVLVTRVGSLGQPSVPSVVRP